MSKIGMQYPKGLLPCYIWWNDQKITLDEYDEIYDSCLRQRRIRFRKHIVIVTSVSEEVPDAQNIKLTGKMKGVMV